MIVKQIRRKRDAGLNKKLVMQAVNSGVKPLVLKYYQVNSCDARLPMAYRTVTIINSTLMGILTPKAYHRSCDDAKVGLYIAEWNVIEAMKHITRFVEAGRNIAWISVRCPSQMVSKVDMYEWMKHLISREKFKYPEKLCLEFPPSLLNEKVDDARLSVLDMKLLGVKTLLCGCAGGDCPMSKIVSIPVDMVMLAPSATALIGSRNKPKVISSLVPYLQSMRAEVYAEGILNDEQITLLNRMDAVGYITSKKYQGKLPCERNMSVLKALSQKDTEDNFGL